MNRSAVWPALLALVSAPALSRCTANDDTARAPAGSASAADASHEDGNSGGVGGGSGADAGMGGAGWDAAIGGAAGHDAGGSATGGSAGAGPSCDDPDGDGYGVGANCLGPDCSAGDSTVHPGATEVCNGVDDDCSGAPDDGLTCKPRLWVFVLAGQSNMVGLGYSSELAGGQQGPVDGAYIYYNDSVHPNTNTLKWMPLAPGFGVLEDRFGPELTFGGRLHALWPNRNIAIIKVAEGGTALHDRWTAGTGDLYQLLSSEVAGQLQALEQGWRPQVVGFVWMQGESDAIDVSDANAYQANLMQFLMQFRADRGLPILSTTAGLIKSSSLWPHAATVRSATTLVATQVGQMDVIDTDDLPTQPADPAHYTSASYITMGERFADNIAAQLPTQWHFQTDLGAAQGDGFWTCRERSGQVQLLTWDAAQSIWTNGDGSVLIGKGFMHPGAASQAELGWWAPFAGKIDVSVAVSDVDPNGGDGVHAEIVDGASTVWSVDLPNGGSGEFSFQTDVVQGKELLFRTSSGALQNPLYDSTSWQIDIQMTGVDP